MRSHLALGIPLRRNDPETRRMAGGISLFDSVEQARSQAQGKRWMGSVFIAEMAILTEQVRIEKTAGPGHYTAWGDPDDMREARRARLDQLGVRDMVTRFGIHDRPI
jgi:hypothetical protein